MQNIIAISGRKQSGKSTIRNFIFGLEMLAIPTTDGKQLIETFDIRPADGKLLVPGLNKGNKKIELGVFDLDRRDPSMIDYLKQNIWPYIKEYGFAEPLKDICVNVLGLTHEQCYGTNEQKESLTQYCWTPDRTAICDADHQQSEYMTAREVMQYIGTIFRDMNHNIWVDTCIRKIRVEQSLLVIVPDCRYPNEVNKIQEAGGKVIRLTRCVDTRDLHSSEKALDPDVFDWDEFDVIIDNQELTITETNKQIYDILHNWGYLNVEITEAE